MQKEDEERRKTEWRRKLEQGSTANGSRKKIQRKIEDSQRRQDMIWEWKEDILCTTEFWNKI